MPNKDLLPQFPFAAVIFDMDGLLVETEPIWAVAEAALLEKRGHTLTLDHRQMIMGRRLHDIAAIFQEEFALADTADTLSDELTALMLDLIPKHIQPKPGAHDLLRYLQAQDIPRAIASSSPRPLIDRVIASQGWDALFTVRCSGDEVVSGKPAPDVYLLAAKQLGMQPEACLALEDSPTGARAAVAAGMTTYAVPDPDQSDPAVFVEITPYRFPSLTAIQAHLATFEG